MSTRFFDICVAEKYKDRQSGEERTRWHTVGTLIRTTEGKMFLKLPFMGPERAFQVFEQKERNQAHGNAQRAAAGEPVKTDFQDDDIPF
jgi:hypothetical protein